MDLQPKSSSTSKNIQLDKIQILNLFKIFDNLPFEPKSENETWYIINKEFIDNLRNYETGKTNSYNNIIKNKIFVEDCDNNNVTTRTRIVKEYENSNGIGFLLYPERAMQILEKHFEFDFKIPRAVYPCKTSRNDKVIYKVDIQPLKIIVYSKDPNEYSNPSKMKIVLLRSDTIEMVIKEIISNFDKSSFKKNLFYADNYDSKREKSWDCLYLHDSTEFPLHKKVCEYNIDETSCLLITHERPDIKCLMYQNETNYMRRDIEGSRRKGNEDIQNYSGNVGSIGSGMNNASISYIFEHGGDRGLINLGNTCFLNSSLQCLAKILKFSNYFLSGKFWDHINYSNPVGQHGRLAKAYYETLHELWKINKRDEPYAPKALKQAISEKRDEFYGYQQHDSQELLAFLLDGLHEDLNLIRKKPYYEEKLQGGVDKLDVDVAEASWNRHKEINNSIIVDLFQGQYRSRLQCPKCKKVSITFDPFMYLSIPLPPKKNHRIWFHVILNRDFPIAMRFSCSFNGSQEVLKLKIFFLNIIKNLKNKRKNILLHSKCIIKNNRYPHEGNNAFNFHAKLLDDKNEFYDDVDEGDEQDDDEANDNDDDQGGGNSSSCADAIKNKSKTTNNLREQDINSIYESICAMCNINTIEELEINNLCFLYTKFKNLACNNFFQVLNNSDFVAEPHTRNGKGISHIFVFILPKFCTHLIDKNMELKGDEHLEVLTNSTVTTNNTSLKDEEMNAKNENNNETKKTVKSKQCTNKIIKKRKGLLPSSNQMRKGEKIYQEEDVEEGYEDTGESNEMNNNINEVTATTFLSDSNGLNKNNTTTTTTTTATTTTSTTITNSNNNNVIATSEHISYDELLKDKIFFNQDFNNLHDKYFSVLIVPLNKDEQLLYKMKNNDLPLLFNVPFNFTLADLYAKVKYAYTKSTTKTAAMAEATAAATTAVAVTGSADRILKNVDGKFQYSNNKLYYKSKHTQNSDRESTKKDSVSTDGGNCIGNGLNPINEENHSETKNNLNNRYDDGFLDKLTLYIPSYNLKEEWTPKDNLGLELKKDGTYLSDYIKNSDEKRLIIIHLNSNGIDDELSLDIKTLTFVDLEERYGIDTCLKLFSEEEHLDENNTWYCGNCKLHVQAYKKLDLFRMPIILILHLKRFNNTNRWLRTKVDSYVYYPHKENEFLNMAPYILEDGLKHMKKLDSQYSPLYELIGVNCHTGGLCGGHYFAYVKLHDKWYNFNDTYVTTIDESQVNTKNAYLLFYQLFTHRNEKFTGLAEHKNFAEEEAIRMANASYYN
ncbi:ubiquitin carboxyl-terminal hydrolase 2 [Plasmodium brasilianum]|uniref:Ubiquitin carboxyl-terminal hydrolase 2, putative n=2 Tax=Plasmodium (Plasmodium) TaxID=418103 RepID=A0A1A8W0D4_PLAMA|nr:ubiquitin carboxyl-terminal hydrolase 2, putative [Plasmodium malariae]KAI4837811.1 ubiquitin carboxyl-terminal hydrolase 2 [Plasmodium brasilianum]SBS86340.1 ubiquitin carboxyl-terminal hydrolase 2, putative [Plasmodium malariae]SCN44856.1 ubiquitin carboxyl-terminal hydrolase 2, putative [Plasmodium malariae]